MSMKKSKRGIQLDFSSTETNLQNVDKRSTINFFSPGFSAYSSKDRPTALVHAEEKEFVAVLTDRPFYYMEEYDSSPIYLYSWSEVVDTSHRKQGSIWEKPSYPQGLRSGKYWEAPAIEVNNTLIKSSTPVPTYVKMWFGGYRLFKKIDPVNPLPVYYFQYNPKESEPSRPPVAYYTCCHFVSYRTPMCRRTSPDPRYPTMNSFFLRTETIIVYHFWEENDVYLQCPSGYGRPFDEFYIKLTVYAYKCEGWPLSSIPESVIYFIEVPLFFSDNPPKLFNPITNTILSICDVGSMEFDAPCSILSNPKYKIPDPNKMVDPAPNDEQGCWKRTPTEPSPGPGQPGNGNPNTPPPVLMPFPPLPPNDPMNPQPPPWPGVPQQPPPGFPGNPGVPFPPGNPFFPDPGQPENPVLPGPGQPGNPFFPGPGQPGNPFLPGPGPDPGQPGNPPPNVPVLPWPGNPPAWPPPVWPPAPIQPPFNNPFIRPPREFCIDHCSRRCRGHRSCFRRCYRRCRAGRIDPVPPPNLDMPVLASIGNKHGLSTEDLDVITSNNLLFSKDWIKDAEKSGYLLHDFMMGFGSSFFGYHYVNADPEAVITTGETQQPPPTLTQSLSAGTYNNWSPSNQDVGVLFLGSVDGIITLTGLSCGQVDGRTIFVQNNGNYNIQFAINSSLSSTENRFRRGTVVGTFTLSPNQSCTLIWSNTNQNWNIL